MVLWNFDRLLQLQRRLDEGEHETGNYVPLKMAMEEPDA